MISIVNSLEDSLLSFDFGARQFVAHQEGIHRLSQRFFFFFSISAQPFFLQLMAQNVLSHVG